MPENEPDKDRAKRKRAALIKHTQVQAKKAATDLARKALVQANPELANAAGVAVEIGQYAKTRLMDGVSREQALKMHGYALGVKGVKVGVGVLTRGVGTPIIDMLEARVFEADMEVKNKVRMASTAKILGMALGLYAGSYIVFPLVSSVATVFIGKNVGELGGRIFVDMTGIKGPLDIYNILSACCKSQAEVSDSVLPPVVRNLWGTDHDAQNILQPLRELYRQYEIEFKALEMEFEIIEQLITNPETAKELDEDAPLNEILNRLDANMKQLAFKRGELHKQCQQFIEKNSAIIDNPERVTLYQHKLRDSLKQDISDPLRKKQESVRKVLDDFTKQRTLSKENVPRKRF